MFRNGQTIYCKNEWVAKQVREYAKHLNKKVDKTTPEIDEFYIRPLAKLAADCPDEIEPKPQTVADSDITTASMGTLKDTLAKNPLFSGQK